MRRTSKCSLALALCLAALVAANGCSPATNEDYRPSRRALELNNKAIRALDENKADEALVLVNDAISTDPEFYRAHANKAIILQALGRNDEAISELEATITMRPDFAEAYPTLGVLYERAGRRPDADVKYKKAIELYDAHLQKNPADVEAKRNRAIAQYLAMQPRDALKTLDELIMADPNDEISKRVKSRIESGDRQAFVKGSAPKPEPKKEEDKTTPSK